MRFLELKELQVLLGLPRSWRSGEGTIASRCPRQHSHKRLIPKDPMVDECSSGVECSKGHKDVCKELVHFFHGTRKTTISRPWGSNLEETEYR